MNKSHIPDLSFNDWLENKFSVLDSNTYLSFPNDPQIRFHTTLLSFGVLDEIKNYQSKLFDYKVAEIYYTRQLEIIKGNKTLRNISAFFETTDTVLKMNRNAFSVPEINIVHSIFPEKGLAFLYMELYQKYFLDMAMENAVDFSTLIESPNSIEMNDKFIIATYVAANYRLFKFLKDLETKYLLKYLPSLIPLDSIQDPLKFYLDFIDNNYRVKSMKHIIDLHKKTNEFQKIYQLQFTLDFSIFLADMLHILKMEYLNSIDSYISKTNTSVNSHELFITNQFTKLTNTFHRYKHYNQKLGGEEGIIHNMLKSSLSILQREFLEKYNIYIDESRKPAKHIEDFINQFLLNCQMPSSEFDNSIDLGKLQKATAELYWYQKEAINKLNREYSKFVSTWITSEKKLHNSYTEEDYIKLYQAKIDDWIYLDTINKVYKITIRPYVFDFSIKSYSTFIKPLFDTITRKFKIRLSNYSNIQKAPPSPLSNEMLPGLTLNKPYKISKKNIPPSFTIDNQKEQFLEDVFNALVAKVFKKVPDYTPIFAIFKKVYSGRTINQKFRWMGSNVELHYFIQQLYKLKIIKNPVGEQWAITSQCFLDYKGKNFTHDQLVHTSNPTNLAKINYAISSFNFALNNK